MTKDLTNITSVPEGIKSTAEDAETGDQFWKSASIDVDYWKVYLNARPKYHTGDFYDRLIKYHKSHQKAVDSLPSIAHDVGTGPGQVAAFLANHFEEVIASDLNKTHLSVAEHLLHIKEGSSNIKLLHAGGEDISKHLPPFSVSMITAAECMPLMNIPKAVSGWADLLRPDGTLAIWFYGRPAFANTSSDSDFDADQCNKIYGDIATAAFRPFYDVSGPRLTNVRKAMDTMVNWLDNIELDPKIWTDVQRWKWNSQLPMEFSDAEDLGWSRNKISSIHDGEKVELVEGQELWSEMWTFEDWKTFLKVNLPAFDGTFDAGLETRWEELKSAIGGSNIKRKVIWPVVAIVATRKGESSASFWP